MKKSEVEKRKTRNYFFYSINTDVWNLLEHDPGDFETFYSTKEMQAGDYIFLYVGKKFKKDKSGIYAIAEIEPDIVPDENNRKSVKATLKEMNYYDPIISEEKCKEFIRTYRSVHRILNTKAVEKALRNRFVNDMEGVNTTNAIHTGRRKIKDRPEPKQKSVTQVGYGNKYNRKNDKASNALELENYRCSYNKKHFSFQTNKGGRMYVEAHHLIPWSRRDEFQNSIDVEANIVSLCSTCHDCIHHGTNRDKYKLIKKLYMKRKDRLKDAGIEVSLKQLLEYYRIYGSFKDEL